VGEALDEATHQRDEATSTRKELEELARKVGWLGSRKRGGYLPGNQAMRNFSVKGRCKVIWLCISML
jgi:hypothetical protein